ncbi:olfactory receptor 52D1-like [Chelonia mydas]|uniref:olfactory receptor 52D1-like n=1 Tax=Chelonia mydas TaxID=8469 RepID=UPI001CA86F3A|nr:olfactory receptor 52D1-like [Chelonia mydas]
MTAINSTDVGSHLFILLGIPGLETAHIWISVPLCCMYIVSLLGNTGVLVVILVEQSLQQPVYLFLSMLATSDLILSSTTVPEMLLMLWVKAGEIAACLTQMFFVHAVFALESAILLAMAFDRLPCCGHHIVHHTYCEHMGIARLACADITVIIVYGLIVPFLAIGLDIIFIAVSYTLILRAVFRLPSKDAWRKALRTCDSHFCIILIFYIPAFFSFLSHCFGRSVPCHIHILLANLYMLVPPTLNPIIYGVKTQLIWARVLKTFDPQRCSP